MNNNLKQLIELQRIDSRLLSIAELRGDLPVKVEELTNELSQIKKDFDKNEERVVNIATDIKKESNTIE